MTSSSSPRHSGRILPRIIGLGIMLALVLLISGCTQNFSASYRRSWEPVTGNETAYTVNINVEKI